MTAYNEQSLAQEFVSWIGGAHSQFHAIVQAESLLSAGGFQRINEGEDGAFEKLKPNGKYYFTRNRSAIVAFAVGGQWAPGNGFNIMAAHSDSPVLKVKPVSKTSSQGLLQVGVECYGGGLWNTWFDRDLSLAGKVIVDVGAGKFETKLVAIERPILKIPNLAIHLNREIYTEGFKPNKETHVKPVLATAIKSALEEKADTKADTEVSEPPSKRQKVHPSGDLPLSESEHHSLLLKLIAEELKVAPTAVRDFELCLYDTQKPNINGALNEFISARGLDNLCMSFVCMKSLIDSTSLSSEKQIRMAVMFDNEEVGSNSTMGAGSNMMNRVLQRLNQDMKTYDRAIQRSFLMSADMAHAVHPNYAGKHESEHRPAIGRGLVIKQNCNQRYASTSITTFLLSEIARRNNLPVQKFVVRNDVGCGSTIGPIVSTSTSIRTLDVGVPQWAMHSIRETCGTKDVFLTYELFKAFYEQFAALDANLKE